MLLNTDQATQNPTNSYIEDGPDLVIYGNSNWTIRFEVSRLCILMPYILLKLAYVMVRMNVMVYIEITRAGLRHMVLRK